MSESAQKRATVYFDAFLHRALRLKAAETDRSISDLVNEAVKHSLAEDADDIAAFGDQTRQFFDEMVTKDCVSRARFDLRRDGRSLPLEVSGFHMQDSSGDDLVVCVADRHQSTESLEK